jgi:hypothetical protein
LSARAPHFHLPRRGNPPRRPSRTRRDLRGQELAGARPQRRLDHGYYVSAPRGDYVTTGSYGISCYFDGGVACELASGGVAMLSCVTAVLSLPMMGVSNGRGSPREDEVSRIDTFCVARLVLAATPSVGRRWIPTGSASRAPAPSTPPRPSPPLTARRRCRVQCQRQHHHHRPSSSLSVIIVSCRRQLNWSPS